MVGRANVHPGWESRGDVSFLWAQSVRSFRLWKKKTEMDARPDFLDLMPPKPNRNTDIFAEPLLIAMRVSYHNLLAQGHVPKVNRHKAAVRNAPKRPIKHLNVLRSLQLVDYESSSDDTSSDEDASLDIVESSQREALPSPPPRKRNHPSNANTQSSTSLTQNATAKATSNSNAPSTGCSLKTAHKKAKIVDEIGIESEESPRVVPPSKASELKELLLAEFDKLKDDLHLRIEGMETTSIASATALIDLTSRRPRPLPPPSSTSSTSSFYLKNFL